VKPAYLQVDLQLLVEGELLDEFAVLWLLLHASRLRHPLAPSANRQLRVPGFAD
jgi:hypothetical protein